MIKGTIEDRRRYIREYMRERRKKNEIIDREAEREFRLRGIRDSLSRDRYAEAKDAGLVVYHQETCRNPQFIVIRPSGERYLEKLFGPLPIW